MEYISLSISFCAILVAILAWHRSRVIYEVTIEDDKHGREKLNILLKGGKYTILHVQSDHLNLTRTIYTLGRIKKNKLD